MKRAIAIADRAALATLKLLAAVNTLFLISLDRRDRACDRQGESRSSGLHRQRHAGRA